MGRFEAQVVDRPVGCLDHYLKATLRRALLIRVNSGHIRSGQTMTGGKLVIADAGAKAFNRFAIL